jgi:hypothetical protein
MKTRDFIAITGISIVAASACSDAPPAPFLENVAWIAVRTNHGLDSLPAIRDSAKVAALVAFANARRDELYNAFPENPVPRVSASFYATGRDPIGSLSAGKGFFLVWPSGREHAMRDASHADLEEFAQLLGVSVSDFSRDR